MFPIRLLGALALLVSLTTVRAQLVVSHDGSGQFNGTDEKPILAALAQAKAAGGGEIIIQPGTYVLTGGLLLKDVRQITLRGLPGAVLKLPPLQQAEAAAEVAPGETAIPVSKQSGITEGMQIRIMAEGAVDSFSQKRKPTFFVKVAKVESDRLLLAAPLEFPIPKGTAIMNENAPNLIEIRGKSEAITIEGLTLDGGRTAKDPSISAHAQLCGVLASGPYNYTEGPTGPRVRGITIRDCTIRNCFGRGVALYAAEQVRVEHCRIEDTVDEAVDLDHFAVSCRVVENDIARCGVGVELNDATDCWVARNRFEACNVGINLWRWCRMPELNRRNQILDNLFVGIKANGIQLGADTSFNFVRGNIIEESGRNGISAQASATSIVENLIIRPAQHGVTIGGDRNEIRENRVVDAGLGDRGKFDGIYVGGSGNRVLDNRVEAEAEKSAMRQPVGNGGKDNVVREP